MAAKKKHQSKPTRTKPPVEVAPRRDDATQQSAGVPGFPIVGIGASAGGLSAFKKFFAAMPRKAGVAFILIPHLDPAHESMMVELIARQTTMPVAEAQDGTKVEVDHVYIIPPNKYMTIGRGVLRLSGPVERRSQTTPIDPFLRSLADDQQEWAICIIFSGTGAHGTLGLKAIKANGGMAMVQDPNTAEYDHMPQSAVATGLADFVLPPQEMPKSLIKFAQHFYGNGERSPAAPPEDALTQILALLRTRTKYDFNSYRKKMLVRRMERRMGLLQIDSLSAYHLYLRDHADEIKLLTRDLFISVTNFFRDPEAFEALAAQVFPGLIQRQDPQQPIRVWVPGAATGEEPYSIAMLLMEQLGSAPGFPQIQVFGTDVDESALETARLGIYPETIAADVSPERLARFFTHAGDDGYQVSKQLRESVVFAVQNLIADPPFSKLDLICCRNLLIYLEPDMQQKVIALLHFALKDGGYLFLGSSETIGRHIDLFEPVSKKWRIYRRIGPARPERVDFSIVSRAETRGPGRGTVQAAERSRALDFAALTQQLLLDAYAPAAVLINRRHEILYYFGPTTRYLDQPTGEPTQDLMMLARGGLRAKLRMAIHKAVRDNAPVTERGIRLKRHGGHASAVVVVQPVQAPRAPDGLLLVTFEDERDPPPVETARADKTGEALVRQLEYELTATRDDLQSNIEELESSNEELKVANEEVMSMNEELQSANEEMETSKEELQSLNEELSTVNSQLQEKVEELEGAANDIANLFNSTDISTIFLDTALRITRFTPASNRLFKLIETDLGRPLTDIAQKFTDPELPDDARQVLKTRVPIEKEVPTEGNGWSIRRVVPYLTTDDRIEGVVVTFVDITQRKREEEEMRQFSQQLERRVRERSAELEALNQALHEEAAERKRVEEKARFLASIVSYSDDAIVSQTLDGIITSWNSGAERIYGYSAAEIIGKSIYKLTPAAGIDELKQIHARICQGEHIEHLEIRRTRKNRQEFIVSVTISPIHDETGKMIGISAIGRDISRHKQLEKEVLEVMTEGQRRVGQDLHDSVGQELTGLALLAEALAETLSHEASPHNRLAERVTNGIRRTLSQVRALSHGLIPVEVDAAGLMVALRDLAARVARQSGTSCDFECAEPVAVEDNSTATHLFRIAQEAVANALKHSRAQTIRIKLYTEKGQVVLEIADDGIGIAANQPAEREGMGLKIMRYRASLINARLTIESAKDQGTTVTCAVKREDSSSD